MLAKLTVKNQLTLPKAIVQKFEGVEYFDSKALALQSRMSRTQSPGPVKASERCQ
jgi:hypothetical protein